MIPVKQTRLAIDKTPKGRGNCYPAVIASILELECESVIQFQELYDECWIEPLNNWLEERGYELCNLDNHLFNDEYYFCAGISPRNKNIYHICIYKNGKLIHDPHPDNTGILTEETFIQLSKIK